MKSIPPFFLALMAIFAPLADSAEINLTDGSVVYGTILSMMDGDDLVVDTAHMDAVTIEWSSVVSVNDTQVVQVELFDGRRVLGTISLEKDVLLVDDGQTLVANRNDLFSLAEVNESFEERISAYTDLGSNFVRGNSRVTQVSLGAGVSYKSTKFETGLRSSTIINEQTEAEDTRRFTLNADYTYNLPRGWGALGYYQFESDEQQGLDGRSLFGAGFGKRLINLRGHRLEAIGGLALNVEEFDQSPRNESTEAFIGARYRLRWFLDADLSYTVYPNLEESDRVRAEFNGSVGFDLLADLDFKLTFYDRYDSRPPQGNKTNDNGLTMGLSWEF